MTATDEGHALLEALLALPRTRVEAFAAAIRGGVSATIFDQLAAPSANPFTTVPRDFERMRELASAQTDGAAAAVQQWIVLARETLGALRSRHVDARREAMAAPGRDRSIAGFIPERTKFGAADDLVQISWLGTGQAAAAAVAYIEVTKHVGGRPRATEGGTAFLIDAQHVMTAFHVVELRDVPREGSADTADLDRQIASARLAFDYTASLNSATYINVDQLVAHDTALDYAILRLPQPVAIPPLGFSLLPLRDPDEGLTFVANIIQHPMKQRKQLGLRNNAVWKLENHHLYYFTDTRGGTSGAPVFDDAWHVIAMHTGWEPFLREEPIYMGRNLGFANRGTLASSLVGHIRATLPSRAVALHVIERPQSSAVMAAQ